MNTIKYKFQARNLKTIFRAVALLGVCGVCFGCEKFLEPNSQSEFSPTRIDQLNEMLLSALPDPVSGGGLTGGFLDVLSDDIQTRAYILPPTPKHYEDIWYDQPYVTAVYAMYTWQPDYSTLMRNRGYGGFDAMYSNIYAKLVYVNSALDYVNRVSGTQAQRDYVRAQCLTLRAFYYHQLVNLYGVPYSQDPDGPGVPLRTTGARENRKMLRNTVGEVYGQIESDLLNAIGLFKTLGPTEQYRTGRPTLPMALLLLARSYLYMENWPQAELYAARLIEEWPQFKILPLNDLVKKGYTNLSPDIETTDRPEERRKQRFYPDFVSYANPDVIWTYGEASDVVALTGKDLSQSSQDSKPLLIKNEVYATLTQASTALVDSYDTADLRLRTYFVRDLFEEPDYTSNPFDPKQKLVYRAYGKLLISDRNESQGEPGVPDLTHRFKPVEDNYAFGFTLRITEAYLILAEAQAMLDRSGEALQTLEAVWKNRFAEGLADVPEAYKTGNIVELVRAERRREFCFEALRWFDLRRWGQPRIAHVWATERRPETYVLELNDPGYTLPMPHTILKENPDLTQVPLAGNGKERPRQD
jgi:hypothetical protein